MPTQTEQPSTTDSVDAEPLPTWAYHIPALVLIVGGLATLVLLNVL